ncbi:MAG: DUF4998 domain-containing protein [Rikenellaceae bacterium]
MKNFLKSTAIFACVALLFCACSEDGTEDLEIPLVDPSTISTVLSGDSRALIQWEVPDDQNITECMVTWKNNKNINEIEYVPVIPGYTAEIEFFDLTEGDYDLTITNLGENRAVIDPVGASLEGTYIYSAETYPTRPNVMRVLTESDAITITWSQIPQHCRGVYITYTDTLNVTKTTPIQSAVVNPTEITTAVGTTTVSTNLNDAKPGSDFYYVTTFKPLDGLDTVYLAASTTASVISEYVAANPENIVIQGGCDPSKYVTYSDAGVGNDGQTNGGGAYFKVKWKVPSSDSIIYSKVYYNLLDDNGSVVAENSLVFGMQGDSLPTTSLYTATYKENDNITQGNVNTRYIEVPEQGYYQIFIQNMKKGGLVSDMVEADQYYLAYNAETFSFPEAYEALNNLGTLSITWYDVPEHFVTMDMSYTNTSGVGCAVTQTANTDGEFDTSLLPGIKAGTIITLTATYLPEDGLESVIITSTEGDGSVVSPDLAPETPTSAITLNPGYSEERGAYVRARWSMNWPDDGGKYDESFNAHSLRLYYGLTGEKTAEYVSIADLDTEEWYIDNLDPDVNYTFYLVSVTEDNVTVSAKVTNTVDTYDINSYNYDDCPTAKAVLLSGVLTFAWDTGFDDALKSVTFTFGGTAYTTEKDAYGWLNSTSVDGTGYDSNAKYTYNYVIFCPEGGLDEITVAINESCSIVVPDIVYSAISEECTIYTAAGMKAYADLINGKTNYSAQTWCEDGTFPSFGTAYTYLDAVLTCDIDIASYSAESAYGWTPMGSSSGAYTGTFNGNGYSISGLWVNRGTSTYQGLFGYISGTANVKNLTLVSPAVYGGNSSGAITGRLVYSGTYPVIENCHVEGGYVYNDAADGTANASIGSIAGSNAGGIVKDCTSSATLYIPTDQGSNNSTSGVGGIVGYNFTSTKYGQVVGCTFSGYVQGKISAAGIVAANSAGYVAGCINEGEVRGSSYTGGVVGFNTSSAVLAASINKGQVYATAQITGSIVGRQAAYAYGCYTTGVVVDDATKQVGLVTGYSNASANTTTVVTTGHYFMHQKEDIVEFLKVLVADKTLTTTDLDYNEILDPDNVDDDETTSMPLLYNVYWGMGSDSNNVAGANVTGVATEVTTIAGMNTAVNAMNTASAYTNWSSVSSNIEILYTYYFLPGSNVSTDLPYPVLND